MNICELENALALILITITSCLHPVDSSLQNDSGESKTVAPQNSEWLESFDLTDCILSTRGRNQFFVLEPGYQLVLTDTNSITGTTERLVITVMDETKVIDGVVTRVVEEMEWINEQIKEISRNYFAICEETKDVFYFGEDVDNYRDGKVINHESAWLAGENQGRPGMIMPGSPIVGMKFYIELSPGRAMDRAEVIKLDEEFNTPAGSFTNCLLTREGTALNPFEREFKTYAPGIGLVQDEDLRLVKFGFDANH